MNIVEYLSLLRTVMYFWLASTSFSLYQLYRDGYIAAKKESKIITSLNKIFLWLSVVFFHLSITSLLVAFGIKEIHQISISLLIVTMFPIGILLTKFRQESIKKQNGHK